ncbi:unnamed protein product [Rotaria sp. Silwood1]|nr:unnamed protein product [Rotaria sp. Silwood1]CAF4940000.1 unnamed protein product [Rotaria sp. Silwood1]
MSFLSCLFFYLLFVHLSYGVDCLLIQNITEARADLCPYVGYSGAICTGLDEKQPRVASVYQQLPRGVGMTLDITSGALLLPAMEYTYPHTTSWTDPVTNQTYWVPQEVSLSSVSTDENQPVARVFLTSLELSNEWKYERLRGKWLGGEFGHSKSMLDIQSRFFSNNQATAVTQKPEVLYRLRVENLQLNNFYAQRRKILLDHRLGGDPSVDQNNETLWRTTLATNPALLKIEQYTPWYEISAITDPAVRDNLLRIIKNRTTTADMVRTRDEAQLAEQRIKGRYQALQGHIGVLNNDVCELTTPVTLGSVANCSEGCSTSVQLKSRSNLISDRPLLYVRDPTTGFVSARVQVDASK